MFSGKKAAVNNSSELFDYFRSQTIKIQPGRALDAEGLPQFIQFQFPKTNDGALDAMMFAEYVRKNPNLSGTGNEHANVQDDKFFNAYIVRLNLMQYNLLASQAYTKQNTNVTFTASTFANLTSKDKQQTLFNYFRSKALRIQAGRALDGNGLPQFIQFHFPKTADGSADAYFFVEYIKKNALFKWDR